MYCLCDNRRAYKCNDFPLELRQQSQTFRIELKPIFNGNSRNYFLYSSQWCACNMIKSGKILIRCHLGFNASSFDLSLPEFIYFSSAFSPAIQNIVLYFLGRINTLLNIEIYLVDFADNRFSIGNFELHKATKLRVIGDLANSIRKVKLFSAR